MTGTEIVGLTLFVTGCGMFAFSWIRSILERRSDTRLHTRRWK